MGHNIKISIVTPVYKSENFIIDLHKRLVSTFIDNNIKYEIIFVNDGSPDMSWEIIKQLQNKDSNVKGISLSKNFGQHAAISAGLQIVSGDWIVVMDCDLQDQPEEIPKLYNKAIENKYDVVFGRRVFRKDIVSKRLTSWIFYKLISLLTDFKRDHTISNFGIYSRQVINNFNLFQERIRLFPLIIQWMGFNIGYLDIIHSERKDNRSSYTFMKRYRLAMDVIIAQSNKPLTLAISLGFSITFLSFIYICILVFRFFILNVPMGYTSLAVAVFFMGGLILGFLGIIGLYIGRMFDQIKNKPIFIIKETI